ncbi:uncharacterized protein MELLADRAFT_124509 [Melampsora larici-populina 98AG31]|uniref:Secreted protein n=1 Tax=Melampsora larici-populina (strain 98AG31 / pathotype 3-4-7) TaxID=747676 RepID=F4S7N3_MELLP|nr:uncharacterized protein MELLADRAFT_124509 [Melampsora larici-populina 98AG31]EGF99364.1 secreted protein [Melampsora larici-populina 98AG31]
MRLSIGTAIFMAFISNQVFGFLTHSSKSKRAMILADEALVKSIPIVAERDYCPHCAALTSGKCPNHSS